MKWEVPISDGADPGAGASVAQLFEGQRSIRVDIFCREDLQNRVDAKANGNKSVSVRYSWRTLNPALITKYFPKEFQDRLVLTETSHLDPDQRAPREGEIRALFAGSNLPVLIIEDFGTTGLNGPVNKKTPVKDPKSPLYHQTNSLTCFFRRNGRSGKTEKQLGSAGLGRHVYYKASQVSSKLIYTVPTDLYRASATSLTPIAPHPLFFGQSFQHELELTRESGLDYTTSNYHHLSAGKEVPGDPQSLPMPFGLRDEDAGIVDAVREDFQLTRKPEESGTSIIIPFPPSNLTAENIAQTIAKEFPIPILKGELRVHVEGTKLDHDTLIGLSSDEKVNEANRFIKSVLDHQPDLEVSVSAEQLAGRLRKELIGDDAARQQLVQDWQAEKVVGVALRIQFGPKAEQVGTLRVFAKRVPAALKGRILVARGGLVLSSYSDVVFSRRYNAMAVVSQDDALGKLLRSAEDASHRKWVAADILHECEHAEALIQFISHSADDLVNLIENLVDEIDYEIFADVLPSGGGPPPPRPDPFVITMPDPNRALIRTSSDYDAKPKQRWMIELVYDSVNGPARARKSFRPGTFDLRTVKTHITKGSLIDTRENILTVQVDDAADFELEVGPCSFATWADIRMRTQMVGEDSTASEDVEA